MRQRVVSRDERTTARVALLAQEKELTRLRDALHTRHHGKQMAERQ
jgi:predicted dithiol-disulfide oxidoreductase (DUF899 family)